MINNFVVFGQILLKIRTEITTILYIFQSNFSNAVHNSRMKLLSPWLMDSDTLQTTNMRVTVQVKEWYHSSIYKITVYLVVKKTILISDFDGCLHCNYSLLKLFLGGFFFLLKFGEDYFKIFLKHFHANFIRISFCIIIIHKQLISTNKLLHSFRELSLFNLFFLLFFFFLYF